jgi:hypothetical protein
MDDEYPLVATVGELRAALADLPDDYQLEVSAECGWEHGAPTVIISHDVRFVGLSI